MKPIPATTAHRYSLQSSEVAVDVVPSEGGRIASLKSCLSGMEFLTQSARCGPYAQPGLLALFQEGPCAGIEECLPTVGPCDIRTKGGPAPDHGDFWQLPWDVTASSDNHLRIDAVGFSRRVRFTKDLTLERNMLRVRYTVENTVSAAQSFLYACHPLFAISAGDRILLPREVHELRLDYSRGSRVGERGTSVSWPVTQSGIRQDITEGPEAGTAEMFYTSRLNEGYCGIYRSAADQILEISFDTQRLPYLGLWICYGGWPDDATGPRQYAVALEPTTSGCNSLAEAQAAGSAVSLEAGELYDWEIQFEITNPAQLSLRSRAQSSAT